MKNNFNTYCKYFLASGITALVISCSNTQFLKKGQMLYTGAEVKIENDTLSKMEKNALKAALEENLTPKPNSSFLGLRPKLYAYNTTKEPKKEKGIRNWLKYKYGEAPV